MNGWHGVTSIVNYVWSRSLDNSSDGEDFEPNAAQPNDSTQPRLEYGPSNFNLPHRFTWIFNYDLPHMGGSWQRLKNGWGFNSTATLQSGQPFQFNYNFEDDFSGSGNAFDRPDVVGPIVYNKRNPFNFVDLNSFAIPCTVDCRHRRGFGLRPRHAPLRQRGPQLALRSDLQGMGFRDLQDHRDHGAPEHAIARGLLQCPQPPQLRQPVPARVHRRPGA